MLNVKIGIRLLCATIGPKPEGKNMSKIIKRISFAGILLLTLMAVMPSVTGCNKNKECKAVITVLDGNNNPVSGVTVSLRSGVVDLRNATDGAGVANFETDLPKILDIVVILGNGNEITTGKVARLEEGKTDNVTVNI